MRKAVGDPCTFNVLAQLDFKLSGPLSLGELTDTAPTMHFGRVNVMLSSPRYLTRIFEPNEKPMRNKGELGASLSDIFAIIVLRDYTIYIKEEETTRKELF